MPAFKGDEFKSLESIYQPDPRENPTKLDIATLESSERTIADHHAKIAPYTLNDAVPENIATQYEVARNIYLYAWHTYRFYMVAEHQALVVLEYAIKESVGKKKIKKFGEKRQAGRGLAACLRYITEKELVCNEDFAVWHHLRKTRAESQYEMDLHREMKERGVDEYEYDLDDVCIEDYAFDHDYLAILGESLPYIRNTHAHGSSMVHNSVLNAFEIVSTIINKLYIGKQNNNLDQVG